MTKVFLLLFSFVISSFANILQDAIDKAQPYSTLKLPSGIYSGRLIINKPITIIGKDKGVVIDGENRGRVITISSSNVILRNLTIRGSGSQMISLDSAIQLNKANHCEISHCRILDSLYGIDMIMSNHTLISDNYITSKKESIEFRGNALKIWYSNNNIIKNNIIEYSKDSTLTYSNNNLLENNTFLNNRFAIHIELSKNNTIKKNNFKYNSVAIMLMMAKDTNITHNKILSAKGANGIGVVLKSTSNLLFQNNLVKYNALGIYIDTKQTEKGIQRKFLNNTIAYNKEGIDFHNVIINNKIVNNNFYANIEDVVKSATEYKKELNIVQYNYWDRYCGFDRDKNNIGDTPQIIYEYANQLWQYNHKIKFFYASPIMALLDFLIKLAPFIEPIMIIEDTKPRINPVKN